MECDYPLIGIRVATGEQERTDGQIQQLARLSGLRMDHYVGDYGNCCGHARRNIWPKSPH